MTNSNSIHAKDKFNLKIFFEKYMTYYYVILK
jgi:hypothetical protein